MSGHRVSIFRDGLLVAAHMPLRQSGEFFPVGESLGYVLVIEEGGGGAVRPPDGRGLPDSVPCGVPTTEESV